MKSRKKFVSEPAKVSRKGIQDIQVFRFLYSSGDQELLQSSHRHHCPGLIFIETGTGRHTIDFKKYNLKRGRVFFINEGQVHKWEQLNRVSGHIILFSSDFYNLIYTGNDLIKSDKIFHEVTAYIDLTKEKITQWKSWFQLLETEFHLSHKLKKEILCLMIKSLMLMYRREGTSWLSGSNHSVRKAELIAVFRLCINKEYRQMKSPSQYAEMLHITPNYLNAVSQEIAGKSAGQLIRDRVILEAKRLLTHTHQTVLQISSYLGFEDNSHFGKYFKKDTGMPPEQFRRKFKSDIH